MRYKITRRCILSALFFVVPLFSLFADVVDRYELNSASKMVLYHHKKGWSPIPRRIDAKEPLVVLFYPGFYRGFIGTLDFNLHLKLYLSLSEDVGLFHVKSIRVQGESGWTYYNITQNGYYSGDFREENLLYNEDGTLFETEDGKNLYCTLIDLQKDIYGRKVHGWGIKKMTVSIEYTLGDKEHTSKLEYLCAPHHFTLFDFIALFAMP